MQDKTHKVQVVVVGKIGAALMMTNEVASYDFRCKIFLRFFFHGYFFFAVVWSVGYCLVSRLYQ